MISAWSYSRLSDFEKCRFKAFLKFVKKIPEEAHPAMLRGSAIHENAELYLDDQADLHPDLKKFFGDEFEKLKELKAQGLVTTEGQWGFDRDWATTDWFGARTWARIKLDAMVVKDDFGIVIDYKTGRRLGNEIAHTEQGLLYQIGAFLRHPALQYVVVEFWYTDIDEIYRTEYSREEGLGHIKAFEKRALAMTEARDFPPSPSIMNCRFCPYKGKECEVGV